MRRREMTDRSAWKRLVPSLPDWWPWALVERPRDTWIVPLPVLLRLGEDGAVALARKIESGWEAAA